MAIRIGNNCQNCTNFSATGMCEVHKVQVGNYYTCDNFEMKAELTNKRDCTTCLRYERDDCANPTKAAPNMMCSVWAPRVSA